MKKIYMLLAAILLCGCATNTDSSKIDNSNVDESSVVSSSEAESSQEVSSWTQTTPGNIVGKYTRPAGVPASKNFLDKTYQFAWAEEFKGDTLNEEFWNIQTGNYAGGNGEKQAYRKENAVVENGILNIIGKTEVYNLKDYTSARLDTMGKLFFHYGYVEASLAIPSFMGAWPAFWMMGESYNWDMGSNRVNWPKCGEIDIMESVNVDKQVHSTLHFGEAGEIKEGTFFDLPYTDVKTEYHLYQMVWDENNIITYYDNIQIAKFNINVAAKAAFREDFFFIINLAIGGDWPGEYINLNGTDQIFEFDYIRVYQ